MSIKKYRYNGENKFKIKNFNTSDKGDFSSREEAVEEFVTNLKEINKLQQKLYAARQEGVIFIFQAMDAAGKDGCIRTVFSTLTPHGVKEYCFKAPSAEELSHDYLWRFWPALPARGNISIFNRSYYEDVLIGKVHKLYKNRIVPDRMKNIDVIAKRYREINDFEKYLYNNATRVVKIFLNVSKEEQAKRFISRIDTPKKNWKVSAGDIAEREYWDEYQEAFESMVNETSSKKSPWYVVPSDHKWYARLIVSRIVLATLQEMDPQFPDVDEDIMQDMLSYREKLIESLPKKYREEFCGQEEETTNIIDDKEIEGQMSLFDLIDNAQKEAAEANINDSFDLSGSYEDVDGLLKIDGCEDINQKDESETKKSENKSKKHKKHKKHKKNKKHKNKKSSLDVQGIMNDLDASTDNAFTDGSDVVVETLLQEEAERAEEKAIEESNEIISTNNDEHASNIEDQKKLLEHIKNNDIDKEFDEGQGQSNIINNEDGFDEASQNAPIKPQENVLPDTEFDNKDQDNFKKNESNPNNEIADNSEI